MLGQDSPSCLARPAVPTVNVEVSTQIQSTILKNEDAVRGTASPSRTGDSQHQQGFVRPLERLFGEGKGA